MPKERLFTRPFLLASAAHFLYALGYNLYLHLPGFLQGLGAGEIEIGVIFGLTAATAIAVRPWLGGAMDARGRRVVILAGGVLDVIVCALYLTVSGLGPWIQLVRVVHGVSEAMLFASLFALAADLVPASRRIEGLAIFGVSGMLPVSLGGLLGDLLLARWDYRVLFYVSVALAVLALALSIPLRDPPRAPGDPPRGIAAAFAQRDLLPLWFVGMTFATSIAAHFTFLKTFVLATKVGSVGLFFSAYAISAVSIRIVGGKLPERLGEKRVLFPALCAMALGQVMLSRAGNAAAVGAAGVLCGLGHGYTFPIIAGLVVNRARAAERGAALAIFTALFDGGTLVGGPLFGAVIRAAGYPAMFLSAAALGLGGAVVFAAWDRRAA